LTEKNETCAIDRVCVCLTLFFKKTFCYRNRYNNWVSNYFFSWNYFIIILVENW